MSEFVVFDFDGVLFDTAEECFHLACTTARDFPEFSDWHDLHSAPENIFTPFIENRFLVAPPWQYAVLLECIRDNQIPMSADDFIKHSQTRKKSFETFSEKYWASRRVLSGQSKEWCKHIRPYLPSEKVFLDLLGQGRAKILSNRDGISIRKIIQLFWNIELNENDLLPQGTSENTKTAILKEFASKTSQPHDKIRFIDDYLHHLIPAREAGFQVYLAGWGYLGPRDRESAVRLGIPCLGLEQVKNLL